MTGTDHAGRDYLEVLKDFHAWRRPANYFEIGTLDGLTLQLATCPSIAVDPEFNITDGRRICNKPECHLYQQTSDEFFSRHNPAAIFGGPIDMAFLDGMHLCEYLLRDFINTERCCRPESAVILHDCLPVEAGITERNRADAYTDMPDHQGWWTGDVWRTALALKRLRPDLRIGAFDAPPTGLVVVTRLDPGSTVLARDFEKIVRWSATWRFDRDELFREMGIRSTETISSAEALLVQFPTG